MLKLCLQYSKGILFQRSFIIKYFQCNIYYYVTIQAGNTYLRIYSLSESDVKLSFLESDI